MHQDHANFRRALPVWASCGHWPDIRHGFRLIISHVLLNGQVSLLRISGVAAGSLVSLN